MSNKCSINAETCPVSLQWANLEGANLDGAEIGEVDKNDRWVPTSFYHARGLTWQQLQGTKLNSDHIDIKWDHESECYDQKQTEARSKFVKDFFHAVNGYMRSADYENALFWINVFCSSVLGMKGVGYWDEGRWLSHRLKVGEIIDANAMASTLGYMTDIFNRLNRPADVSQLERLMVWFRERVKEDNE